MAGNNRGADGAVGPITPDPARGPQPAAPTRASWSGRLAFVLAAAGSAVGLGTIWRFPYLAAHYGGGMFLLVFVVFMLTLGVSLLILETALGRRTGMSVIGAFAAYGRKYRPIGAFIAAIPFIIASYYAVIGGWVTRYVFAYAAGMAAQLADGGTNFMTFVANGPVSVAFMLLFAAVTFIIVALGVNGGIEKANLVMMPALIVVSVGVAAYALAQPGALDGLAYLLLPDVSKFSLELVIAALGQTFFGLSVAVAIMVTYGSYMKPDVSITTSAFQTAGTTLGISLLAGLMVVPAAFVALGSGEAVAENSGPSLMFLVLPQVFQHLGAAASAIGFVFFLLVMFAALTSMISLVEACTSLVQDGAGWTRRRSLIAVIVVVSVVGVVVTLGYSSLSFVQPLGAGSTILDLFDFVTNSVMMPIAALATCVFVGWVIGPGEIVAEVRRSAPFRGAKAWTVMVRYVAPVLLVAVLVSSVLRSLGVVSF